MVYLVSVISLLSRDNHINHISGFVYRELTYRLIIIVVNVGVVTQADVTMDRGSFSLYLVVN